MRYLTLLLSLATLFWSASDVAHAEPLNLRFGAIIPLTGEASTWGEPVRSGLLVGRDRYFPGSNLIFEDEGVCEAAKALTAYRKLTQTDNVKIIFLGCLAGIKAIAPVAAKDDVLLLSLGMLDSDVLKTQAPLINLAADISSEGQALAKVIAREKPKKVGAVLFADAFGQGFRDQLTRSLASYGIPLDDPQEASASTTSFASLITRWKNGGVDLLATTLSDRQQLTLIREAKQLGFAPKIFSSSAVESLPPPKAELSLYEGIKYPYGLNDPSDDALKKATEAEIAKGLKAGQLSNLNALFAVDGFELLKEALAPCTGQNQRCLYDFFRYSGKRHGLGGRFDIKEDGGIDRPYVLKTVKNGQFVQAEEGEI